MSNAETEPLATRTEAVLADATAAGPRLVLRFDHGLGDCVHFAQVMQLYRRRGYRVAVHYEENKAELWRAAGAEPAPLAGSAYVPWVYPPGFGDPANDEVIANKIAANLRLPPLPEIGDPATIWEELAGVHVRVEIAPADGAHVRHALAGLPRPWILVHTDGTNFAASKNVPRHLSVQLYRCLLDQTGGSLVILDWDRRSPRLPHGRVRNLHELWPHASLAQLAALFDECDLLIGVDSGPYHFAALTDIPAIGLWRGLLPIHCALRRGRTLNLAPARWSDALRSLRLRWNLVHYPGDEPDPADIAESARRMLAGPRYVASSRLATDVVLQQMVASTVGSTPLSPHADRQPTFDAALRHLGCFAEPRIVEVGCIRSLDDWAGAGNSTYLFAAYLAARGSGSLTSIDTERAHLERAAHAIDGLGMDFHPMEGRGAEVLDGLRQPIDLLYLDGSDEPEETVRELRAAAPLLHSRSLILVDDTVWLDGWQGKGRLAVAELEARGWQLRERGYQLLFTRRT